jgi:hypothetical protein
VGDLGCERLLGLRGRPWASGSMWMWMSMISGTASRIGPLDLVGDLVRVREPSRRAAA